MSKKFLLSLSYLSLCKFFWTKTKNRVIENRVMENRVKRGITVVRDLGCFLTQRLSVSFLGIQQIASDTKFSNYLEVPKQSLEYF